MKRSCQPYHKSGPSFWRAAAALLLAAVALLLLALSDLRRTCDTLTDETQSLQEQNQKLREEVVELSGYPRLSPLSVKGTQLCDEKGQPVLLRGISSHGIAWYPEYTNYRALKTLKDHKANVFRIAMYVEQNDGYLEEPEWNRKLLYSAIENSLAAGLYTIVDWHVLRDEDPNKHIDQAIAAFEEITRRYGDEPGILYEICNEPNGDTDYDDIKAYADQVIPVIRKNAPNAVVLVGTPNFCTSLSEAMEDPLEYPNVMYTYHYYAGISDCKFAMQEISRGLERGLPVFISEWGLDGYDATQEHMQETEQFLDFLDQKNISWVNWALSNKDEGYSLIDPRGDKLHGWEWNELSDTGRFVFRRLSETAGLSDLPEPDSGLPDVFGS